jgi:hypothetical protein
MLNLTGKTGSKRKVTKARKDNTTGLKVESILKATNTMVKKDIKNARLQRHQHLLNLSKRQ